MPVRFTSALLLAATAAYASVNPASHAHTDGKRLPSRWYHEEDHPVHNLFRRGSSNDGISYAAIGTSGMLCVLTQYLRASMCVDWSAGFPADSASTTNMPQLWLDALNNAVAAGKIPDVPMSTSNNSENPVYPSGYDPNSATVCSSTYRCVIPGDIWDAPSGVVALSFDDGPLPVRLYFSLHDWVDGPLFRLPTLCTTSSSRITNMRPTFSSVRTFSCTRKSFKPRSTIRTTSPFTRGHTPI